MKKIGALLLAIMMIAVVGLAYATSADMTGEEGVIGEFREANPDTPYIDATSVIIYKEITALNPETCTVNAPTIKYMYAITPVVGGATITDASSHHAQINETDVNVTVTTKTGVGEPVITGTTESNGTTGNGALYITPADQLDASEFGTANRFPIKIDFSAIDFTKAGSGAGVYRYQIAETTEAVDAKAGAGILEGDVANTLFMDVYVNGNGAIYGYTLFTNNDDIDASPDADSTAANSAGKTEGFVGDKADGSAYTADDSTADKYYTFNFDVSKKVENDNYAVSTEHQFPFDVTFANTNVTAAVLPKVTHTGTATYTAPTTAAGIASFSFNGTAETPSNNLKIANNAVVSFVGIPCGTTVTIKEKNDVIGVTYSSVSTGADTDAVAKSINTGNISNEATIDCTSHITRATENHTDGDTAKVLFTNTLLEISPTGVVLRVAPYMLMLVAGVALLLIAKKRKNKAERA